jgi:uncharacterized protein
VHDAYHRGEIAVQERAGERAIAERRAAIIAARLADGARAFLAEQSVVAVAAEGPDGSPLTSLWCGEPGLLRADDSGEHVELAAEHDFTLPDDVVRPQVRVGAALGLLVIDLSTRRRLRINGAVTRVDAHGVGLRVRETFGNCIKYIQRRELTAERRTAPDEQRDNVVAAGRVLDAERRAFISRADTLFVGSVHGERGIDVSHRGGEPGFVHIDDDATLRIPDYSGNSMYQTFGNFEVDSRAGVAVIDFERRRVLSIAGRASTSFGVEDPRHPTGGTGRYWTLMVERWVDHALPRALSWTLVDRSPFNPPPSR